MNKMLLLVGAGIGYVLGARAGRERYDQIADQANKLWTDPRVQTKVEEVKAKAPEMAHQVGEQAKSKVDEAKHRVSGGSSGSGMGSDSGSGSGDTFQNATGSYDPETGTTTVDTTGFGPGGEKLP
ncbi:YtxH domain-containing protein [Ornithinimicrobium pekingense]|uniref:YtxH domain-containing protein n=1 Tax=Ornithinimicrobium pekingense TaxID=384677 RepID=A0ABQ2FAX3_9MICO|nr:YtxH domain-containing protein [Ornithinimicrobium pekingense]GGK78478.1 hypothetical protein GCM10011509_28760 [Ornithinimicrobium pekingense]